MTKAFYDAEERVDFSLVILLSFEGWSSLQGIDLRIFLHDT